MKNSRGMFIVFEGIDGSGKSTQIEYLARHIKEQDKYQDVLLTREPTWRAEEIKKTLLQDKDSFSGGERLAELFVEDRRVHTHEQIVPALEQGAIVLSDRYSMSTLAYQSVQGVNLDYLLMLHEAAGTIKPDLSFLIDVFPERAMERIAKRKGGVEKFEKQIDFQKRLADSYRNLAGMSMGETDSLVRRICGFTRIIDGDREIDEIAKGLSHVFDFYQKSYRAQKGNV